MKRERALLPVGWAAVVTCIVMFAWPHSVSADAGPDAIVGAWLTDGGESKVEIARSGSQYAGKIVWLKEPERDGKPVRDSNNSNLVLRDRPVMGLDVLSGFSYAANGVWSGGSVYSPRKGRSYPAELSLAREGRLDIKVKDGIFSKHLYWSR